MQKADLAIAAQKVEGAESRLSAARNGAFSDGEAMRSLTVSEKELQLAEAERDLSQSLLERTTVMAAQDGLLIYASRSELMGKPVRTGEKVMEIADPAHVAFRIDLSVKDSIVLAPGAAVRLFLDADPLHPLSAEVREMAYHAQEVPGGTLAYDLRAQARSGEAPRIGLRGTAQVTGEKVALGFYLLRRPLAALRQYFGR
jgi:multidrug resistance efflux pump